MTRLDYFKSLFPDAEEKAFRYIFALCPKELGLCDVVDCNEISCQDCWKFEYKEVLPCSYKKHILDKFNKLW